VIIMICIIQTNRKAYYLGIDYGQKYNYNLFV
jgi:hypothetical protein